MGCDKDVADAARVSFDVSKRTTHEQDAKLIHFLARGMTTDDFEKFVRELSATAVQSMYHDRPASAKDDLVDLLKQWRRTPTHFSPFTHCVVKLRLSVPLFILRQLNKHQVGFTVNEVSRRYVSSTPDLYRADEWRAKALNAKQGSSDRLVDLEAHHAEGGVQVNDLDQSLAERLEDYLSNAVGLYRAMLFAGVCPEQARMILPQNMMTTIIWTGSLAAWARVYTLRTDPHTQRETRDVAEMIGQEIQPLFPVSWEALTK